MILKSRYFTFNAAINNPVKVFEVLNKPTTRPNNAQRYSDLLTIKNQSQIPNSGISFSKTQTACSIPSSNCGVRVLIEAVFISNQKVFLSLYLPLRLKT